MLNCPQIHLASISLAIHIPILAYESSCRTFSIVQPIRIISIMGCLLWLKFDTFNKQSFSFLDEVVDDAYTVLQSEKEAQWKDISDKKTFLMMFLIQMTKYQMVKKT